MYSRPLIWGKCKTPRGYLPKSQIATEIAKGAIETSGATISENEAASVADTTGAYLEAPVPPPREAAPGVVHDAP